jgi:hypothetical protein
MPLGANQIVSSGRTFGTLLKIKVPTRCLMEPTGSKGCRNGDIY